MFADSFMFNFEFFLTDLHAASEGVTSATSLGAGSVWRQFPSLKGTTWRDNGSNKRNGSRVERHIRLLRGEY